MKKFLTVILTAAMILSVASCGGKKEETTTAPETAPQVTEPETSETEAATEETTEEATEETTEEAPAEEEAPSEEENADETETQRLANVVLNSGVEFPATMFVDDPDMVKDMLGYDMADAEEYSIVTHLIIAHLVEITIIKVKDGKMDAVMEMLNKRKDDLLNNVADTCEKDCKRCPGKYIKGYNDAEIKWRKKREQEAITSCGTPFSNN